MSKTIFELYPQHGVERTLEGVYLSQDLRSQSSDPTDAFVYANFISSLDGRIAVQMEDGNLVVPASVTNARDWRLFQELAVQADILLSTGRYLRDYQAGRAQEILRIYDDPALADLADWRLEKGLDRHPAIAVISASLDFPLPPALIEGGRTVVVLTTEKASAERKQSLSESGLEVLTAGTTSVDGKLAVDGLVKLGFRRIYSAAGPRVLHLLLEGGVLDRLHLTYAARLLGGRPFSSILEGPLLAEPADFVLRQLLFDPHAPDAGGQLIASFDRE